MFLYCPLYLDLHKYHKKILNSGNSLEKEDKRKKITKKTFILTNLDGTAQMSKERKRTNKSYMTCYFELWLRYYKQHRIWGQNVYEVAF